MEGHPSYHLFFVNGNEFYHLNRACSFTKSRMLQYVFLVVPKSSTTPHMKECMSVLLEHTILKMMYCCRRLSCRDIMSQY